MRKSPIVLLIHEASSDVEPIRQALSEQEGFRLQGVTRLQVALARIAGGGVDGIVVDLSSPEEVESERLDRFLKLRSAAPHLPIVVLCESDNDALSGLTTRVGASASLTKEQCEAELRALIRRLIQNREIEIQSRPAVEHGKTTPILTVLGSKGGVGTTTVALNVACSLALNQRVILVELRPTRGTLSQYFVKHNRLRDLSALLTAESCSLGTPEIDACLWSYRNVPGLRILFGPQGTEHDLPISFGHAKVIVQNLTTLADHVVIDLPSMPSDANRAAIQASECLALVVERDPICLESARLMLETITSWGSFPRLTGTVIVNRAPVVAPVPIEEFETRLGVPILAVIPPAADDCIAAQRANCPLVAFDRDTLAASSLVGLANLLSQTSEPPQFERKLAIR